MSVTEIGRATVRYDAESAEFRALARMETTTKEGGQRPPLGTTEIKKQQSAAGAQTPDQIAYSRKLWGLQRTMWSVTQIKRLAGCHRWLAPGASTARLEWTPGRARFGGLQDSHSVWSSPLSAATIGKTRATEIEQALTTWLGKEGKTTGHGVSFATLTLSHSYDQPLDLVWNTVAKCWAAVTQTASWRGGKRMVGDVQRFGIEHWVKTTEVTYGKNGWHCHLHVLLLTDAPLSAEDTELLRARIFGRWSAKAVRLGFRAPSEQRGVKIDAACAKSDVAALSSYMAKSQLEGVSGLGDELTGAVVKKAKGANFTPFQVLERLASAELPSDERAKAKAIWWEWEKKSSGRRQIAWSKGAKDDLLIDDVEDEDISDEDFPEDETWLLALISNDDWKRIASNVALRQTIVEMVSRAQTSEAAERLAQLCFLNAGVQVNLVKNVRLVTFLDSDEPLLAAPEAHGSRGILSSGKEKKGNNLHKSFEERLWEEKLLEIHAELSK